MNKYKNVIILFIFFSTLLFCIESNNDIENHPIQFIQNDSIEGISSKKIECRNTILIFVHGAGLNSSIWDKIVDKSCKNHIKISWDPNRENFTLGDYTKEIRLTLDRIPKNSKVVLISHSIGTMLAQASIQKGNQNIIGHISISGIAISDFESFTDTFPFLKRIFLKTMIFLFGTLPPRDVLEESLCTDIESVECDEIISGIVPESKNLYLEKPTEFKNIPNTIYILTTKDSELNLEDQVKYAKNLKSNKVLKLFSGHLPMISKPEKLNSIINIFLKNF